MKLAKLYVDDVRWLISSIKKGWRFIKEEGLMFYDPVYEGRYGMLSDYEYTCMVIRDIINRISDDMQFTFKTQFDFENKLLPTLAFELQ